MKKRILVLFLLCAICITWGVVYATPARESSVTDAKPMTIYGKNGSDLVAITVGTSGNIGGSSTLAGGAKNVTAAGTAEVLAASTACKKVLIKASLDNTGNVFVGGSDVDKTTENGYPLDAGEVWIGTIDNLADIYIDVTVSGEGVSYSYEN